MNLVEQINKVMELDAKRKATQNAFENSKFNTVIEVARNMAKNDLQKKAPLMASIIRQLTDIVKQQHEAWGTVQIYIYADTFRGLDNGALAKLDAINEVVTNSLALSAPIVKGVE